jgi:hypothetical protein
MEEGPIIDHTQTERVNHQKELIKINTSQKENFQSTNYNQWLGEVKKYEKEKKTLAWGYTEKPKRVSYKEMKEKELIYNPVLQIYRDHDKESNLRVNDKINMIETLAKNKDNALRIEQTFDIINLNDKLKGLEGKIEAYPTKKNEKLGPNSNYKTNSNFVERDYNILSGITVDKHSFLKPQDRKKNSDTQAEKKVFTRLNNYRDYDIISNKYKENDEEKKRADLKISRYNSAKIFNIRNTYDPIKGKYYDDDREKNYMKTQQENIKTWGKLNKRIIGEGDLYNPINMSIVDDKQLLMADKKNKDKKKRYETRYQIEEHYRNQSLNNLDKRNNKSKQNPKNESNWNLINGKNYDNNWYNNQEGYLLKTWDKLEAKANPGNTFKSKTIYRDLYDFSESNLKETKFMNQRKGIKILI